MGWFFGKKKKKSSDVAKDRLKLVLIYDRQGTTSNNSIVEMMKKDLLAVISKYLDVDADESIINITNKAGEEGIVSQLTANIPIKNIKKMTKNTK